MSACESHPVKLLETRKIIRHQPSHNCTDEKGAGRLSNWNQSHTSSIRLWQRACSCYCEVRKAFRRLVDEQTKVAKTLTDVGIGGWTMHGSTAFECAAGTGSRRSPATATGRCESVPIDESGCRHA